MVAVSLKKFFFQAEDGIRDVERSRGLGDVYKRQNNYRTNFIIYLELHKCGFRCSDNFKEQVLERHVLNL